MCSEDVSKGMTSSAWKDEFCLEGSCERDGVGVGEGRWEGYRKARIIRLGLDVWGNISWTFLGAGEEG